MLEIVTISSQPLTLLIAVVVYDLQNGTFSLCLAGGRAYAGPTVWNSLPDALRNSDSFDSFKRFLKTILFSRY